MHHAAHSLFYECRSDVAFISVCANLLAYGQLDKVLTKKEQEAEKQAEYTRQNQMWSFAWSDCQDATYIGQCAL